MPFLVYIFAGGKRKRVDEGDVLLLSPVSERTRHNNVHHADGIPLTSTITTTTSASTACLKNHSQDAEKEQGEEGRCGLLKGAVEDGAINPRPRHDPPATTSTTTDGVGTATVVNNNSKKCRRTDDVPCHSFHADPNHHHANHPQNGNFYQQWCSSSPSSSSSRSTRNPSSSGNVLVGAEQQQTRRAIRTLVVEMEDRKLKEQEQGKHLSSSDRVDTALDEEDQRDFDANYSDHFNDNTSTTAEMVSGSSFDSSDYIFEKRYQELVAFREEFGHCIVPNNYADNISLGHWCNTMRTANRKLQMGIKVPGVNLQPDRIERLEEIGFEWHFRDASFHKRYQELVSFKKEFGHCNVPRRYKGISSLGRWCNMMRSAYSSRKQMGNIIPSNLQHLLSQDRIEQLEEIGFKWQIRASSDDIFEKRYHDLVAFKEKFGHCSVPRSYKVNPSLGDWCARIKTAYRRIQRGLKTDRSLLPDRIERLEEIGFQWGKGSCHL